MIKINLLLQKKRGQRGGLRKEYVLLIGAVVLLGVLLSLIQWRMNSAVEETAAQIASTKQEIAKYKSMIAEASKAKEAQKMLQAQLDIINALRKEKSGPAKVLDELSVQKPEKLHLEAVKKEGGKLGIEGVALDDETIANFMTNLRKSKVFKAVDLVVSQQIEQSNVKLKKFTLSCEISFL